MPRKTKAQIRDENRKCYIEIVAPTIDPVKLYATGPFEEFRNFLITAYLGSLRSGNKDIIDFVGGLLYDLDDGYTQYVNTVKQINGGISGN